MERKYLSLLTLYILIVALTGCASHKAMYELSDRNPENLAVIYGEKRTPLVSIREAGATICKIDKKSIDSLSLIGTCDEGPLYIEPGVHEFEVKAYVGAVNHITTISFELEAGHQYLIETTGDIISASMNSMTAQMAIWVEDRTTGTVVYGKRPDNMKW